MAWLDGWDNRLKLTIDHERIDETLTDFPLYITLASGIGRNNFDATVVFDELSPAPLYTVIFDDDFSSNDGYGWEITTATVNFNNNRLELTDTGGSHAKATTSGNLNAEDWEIRFDVTPNDFSSGDADYLLYWCYVDDVNTFQIYLNPNAGVNWLQFSANVGGVSQFAHQSTKYNYNAEGYISYTIVARKEANHFYFKHWRTGADTEPITWDYNTYVVAAWPTNGKIRCRASSAVTSYFDNITLTLISPLSYSYPYRLAITDHTGINKLPVEIECWNQYSQRASLWTKIPTISSGTDTSLYLYYDSNQLDNNLWIGDTGTAPALEVWDDNYAGVWHLAGTPDNSAASLKDSTDTGNHGTSINMDGATDSISEGKFIGINTDGVNEYAYTVNDASLQLTSNFSVECVAKTTSLVSDALVAKTDSGNTKGWGIKLRNTTNVYLGFKISTSHYTALEGNTAFNTTDYYYIGFSYVGDGSNPTVVVNDWLENMSVISSAGSGGLNGFTDSGQNFGIGVGNIFTSSTTYHTGPIVEVRYSNTIRSSAWLKATYYTMFDDLIIYSQGQKPVFTASGTVTVDGLFINSIPVRLYRRLTGELVGEATTYSGGLFEIDTPYDETHYIMSMYTTSGTNAIIYDWIAP